MQISADKLYEILYSRFGDTGWWPAETPDEVVIGAILTQNTAWRNVEISLQNMKSHRITTLETLAVTDPDTLGPIIRSSGFFRQKSSRLVGISAAILEKYGSIGKMKEQEPDGLKEFLSSQKGIGQETMDCILLYVLDKPEFVVDRYTIRVLERIGIKGCSTVSGVKQFMDDSFNGDLRAMKNFHGMFVELAKEFCRVKPICTGCPVREKCDYGSRKN